MTEVLKMVAVVSLVSAFIILLLKKWGVAEWMQVHGDDIGGADGVRSDTDA